MATTNPQVSVRPRVARMTRPSVSRISLSAYAAPPTIAAMEAQALAVPDLLHAEPIEPGDAERTKLSIGLAFAGGGAGGLFDEVVDAAPRAKSAWEPALFANDLFLSTFVAQWFVPRIDGHDVAEGGKRITRLLGQPPDDPAIVHFRRAIMEELLESPLLRRDLEQLHGRLARFRGILEGATGMARWDENRRQLDVLQLAKDIFDLLAEGFASARSGLARLREFGRRVVAGEPYRSLADLLHYDQNLATLSLKVGVGADGRIRGFEITAVEANAQNPFVTSALRRWMVKLELFARGFRFDDGEVMARLI